jgi:hypothetical protein
MRRQALIAAAAIALLPGPALAKSYLLSLRGISLRADESIERFSLKTWGVEIKAVCHIPADWEITAGQFGPLGRIAGEAGHGATELRRNGLTELQGLAIVELSGPVQLRQQGSVPATFGGDVNVYVGSKSRTRIARLTSANVGLTPTSACPIKS